MKNHAFPTQQEFDINQTHRQIVLNDQLLRSPDHLRLLLVKLRLLVEIINRCYPQNLAVIRKRIMLTTRVLNVLQHLLP